MKKAKKVLTMLLTVAMVVGSLGVVMAGSNSGYIDVTPSCSAYCDVWCESYSSTASTHLYLDYNYDSVNASASLMVKGGRELGYAVLGSDSVSESSISSLRVMADAEVSYYEVPYVAQSDHSASVEISTGHSLLLEAYFD